MAVAATSASDFNEVIEFKEYNPTPYKGGYDLAQTFGEPLPPSDAICYPRSQSNSGRRSPRGSDLIQPPHQDGRDEAGAAEFEQGRPPNGPSSSKEDYGDLEENPLCGYNYGNWAPVPFPCYNDYGWPWGNIFSHGCPCYEHEYLRPTHVQPVAGCEKDGHDYGGDEAEVGSEGLGSCSSLGYAVPDHPSAAYDPFIDIPPGGMGQLEPYHGDAFAGSWPCSLWEQGSDYSNKQDPYLQQLQWKEDTRWKQTADYLFGCSDAGGDFSGNQSRSESHPSEYDAEHFSNAFWTM